MPIIRLLPFAAGLILAACASMANPPTQTSDGVLTGANGMTLYTFDRDPVGGGKSVCNGPCAANWPPLAAGADAKASGDWSIVTRDDGTKQWAYKGAPLSMVVITPAVAGPYDIGTVVVRVALNVNPETAQINAVSDPIPNVFGGVKLDIRSIDVNVNRHNFMINPTNCAAGAVAGTINGGGSNPANAAEGTIRKTHSLSIGENSVHGSDAPETAAQEIRFWFSDTEIVG